MQYLTNYEKDIKRKMIFVLHQELHPGMFIIKSLRKKLYPENRPHTRPGTTNVVQRNRSEINTHISGQPTEDLSSFYIALLSRGASCA